jgi:hypothetical protein
MIDAYFTLKIFLEYYKKVISILIFLIKNQKLNNN